MKKNINFKNNIGVKYFNKNSYLRDKRKLKNIINTTLISLDNNKDSFHLFSKHLNFNHKYFKLAPFNKYKSIILIGMGGSALGAAAIYSFCSNKIKKKFIFLDNLDQLKVEKLKKNKNFKSSLFIIISKSGRTIETLINTNLFKNKINNKNTIIITEKKANPLNIFAKKKKILLIDHKYYIGGRYSVLSEVGMVPAYFMGLKISNFRKKLLSFLQSKEKNYFLDTIIKLSHIYKYKKINSFIFLNYAPEVDGFLYWCQQLIAESLGKKGMGILPVISTAPKDHHSLMQLYLDGPRDKMFYIFSLESEKKMKIKSNIFGKSFDYTKNKDLSKIKIAQKNALIQILKNKKIPYQEFIINKKNEETLGELFTYFILETIFTAKLLGINPFDQPAVEQVKVLTKNNLS